MPGMSLLRVVVGVCTGLALTACGGPMTPEEAAAEEASLATTEAALGSCANWSEWINSGGQYCSDNRACGLYWYCEGDPMAAAPRSITGGGPEHLPPPCDDGSYPYQRGKPGLFNQQYSYRVCFDAGGTYTHTEYQYQYAFSGTCGC
ncbi:hypothetical protein D7Y11_24930 [Corallococcus sp. AB018]|uniref:hypothetical protein n=1 Tax=Corallococcus sp. AB018 TaxID=2316715 RepID=UPI000F8860BD|nr:hypothetical protein [Corallococcus sp. AB018]RUO90486.1 hypothetical protein D7Y11_24930 [Corallococcus sp. AB018]